MIEKILNKIKSLSKIQQGIILLVIFVMMYFFIEFMIFMLLILGIVLLVRFVLKCLKKEKKNFKIPGKMTWITVLVIFLGLCFGSVHDQSIKAVAQAQKDLQALQTSLVKAEKSHISKDTQSKITHELADTKQIISSRSLSKINGEKQRLEDLQSLAKTDETGVSEITGQAKTLTSDSLTSSEDKKDLANLLDKIDNYQNISSYKSEAEELFALVSAHNNRSDILNKAAEVLKDKDLSAADRGIIESDIKELNSLSTAKKIDDSVLTLSAHLDESKSNIQKAKEAAKKKAEAEEAAKKAAEEKAKQEAEAEEAAKKAAEEKAKQEAEAQKAAEEKAQQEAEEQAKAANQNSQSSNSASSGPITDGKWTTAEPGYCYYRSNSGKYYTSVVNPGNYIYMTISEAQAKGGTPGHSNGSARN